MRMFSSKIHGSFLSLILGLVTATQGAQLVRHDNSFVPNHVLRVTAEDYSQACMERYSVLVNGSFPGPELRLQEDETSWIRVYNDMEDANVTMHWHGLTAFTAPFSDGTPAASQWPIPPGHFFDYEVHPEAGYAGTYFYHSHIGFQAVSAAGPLIVEAAEPPPYEYDEERIIALSDFFLKTDEEIEEGLTSSNFEWSGDSLAILVNGKGLPAGGSTGSCELAAIDIEPGKTYRLRFIGATALSFLWVGLEGHEMSIIEADGHYTQPVESEFLQIGSGQRYSVLLKAKTEEELQESDKQHFYLQMSTLEDPNKLTSFAVLQYPSSNPADLTTTPSSPPFPEPTLTSGWLDYELQPLNPDPDFPTLEEVTRRIIITAHQNVSDHIVWLQSGYDWVETFPSSPYLVDMYKGKLDLDAIYDRAISNGNGFDNITRIFPAQMDEVIEIIWQNQGGVSDGSVQSHPFHGHGRHFYDIGGGDGSYDVDKNEERLKNSEPVTRDTTMLYGYRTKTDPLAPSGWRGWRLRVTDAGVWMMHCHILHHMVMGMQTVFIFGNEEDIASQSGPVNDGYLTYGGDSVGNDGRAPVVRHFFGQGNARFRRSSWAR
ncbi:hypothetical protein FQN54_009716 [Arachnomyces sp. PD_36]|nr:hypothetical protein FQN54_009716 [Arachnomyces sp. PD_36]